MRRWLGFVLLTLTSLAAFAQTTSSPTFEVASIRVSGPGRDSINFVPGSLTMRTVSLTDCIRWAYRVQDFQIAGPNWLNETRFDILAKAATPAKEDELREMLKTLLAERFKLMLHHQTKEMTSLILTVAKTGHKLKPTEIEGSPSFQTGKMNLTGQGATLSQLTEFLSQQIHVPVVDQTGLSGRFNYALDISSYVTDEIRKDVGTNGVPLDAPSIISQAVQAQLGLKMDSKKMPVEVLVIDQIEKTPSEN